MARLIYIFVLMLALPTLGQKREPAFQAETLSMTVSTTSLVAGETLYYKVICLNPDTNKASEVSTIAYVELAGSDRKTVGRQKIRLENSVGGGDFFIAPTLASGNYKLVGYTRRMLEDSALNFFSMDLIIVNPFQPFDGQIAAVQPPQITPNSSGFTVTTDKRQYSARDKIVLKINPDKPLKGHYSVSVKKAGVFEKPHVQPARVATTEKANGIAEVRGEIVSGRIVSPKNAANLGNRNIALSIPGKSFGFKIVQTDRDGRFIFVLDKTPNHAQAVIQVMGPDRQDFEIVMDQPVRPDYSKLVFDTFALPENAKEVIADRTIASQVENAYFDRKKDSVITQEQSEPFFHPLEKVYVLDDYTRFPTLRETIIEVVKEMYFTKTRGHYTIHLRNTSMDIERFGPSLILIDGLLVQDHDELFSYGARYIEKVSLINEPYLYGPKTFGGIANFTTKLQDFKSSAHGSYIQNITLERPEPQKIYHQHDYSGGKSRIPDYRHQLLWKPEITGESEDIPFYASDITGLFTIEIQGFTESGTPIYWTGTFEVQ